MAAGQAEQLLIVEQQAKGLIPDGVTRPMYPWEVRSGVNFAEMSRTLSGAQSRTASSLDELRDVIVGVLTQAIGHLYDEDQVQAELMRFAESQPSEVRKAIAASADQIQDTLDQLYADGADEVVREAIKQGVSPAKAVQQGLEAGADEFAGTATVAPVSLWSKLLDVAVKAGGARLLAGGDVVDLVVGATMAGTYDLARQATNIVHGLGRQAAANDLPAPSSAYASEILDGETCDECEKIDGYEYISLDEAYADYPDAGPYKDCLGGDRCRGTILFIWDESPPADNPDDQ